MQFIKSIPINVAYFSSTYENYLFELFRIEKIHNIKISAETRVLTNLPSIGKIKLNDKSD
jgi:hypothetical protein